ncbi:MAG TPA: hypothetical protein EYP31_05750 [Roseibacterium sp.]|nr:hypothetical protein [Roseibacterium sp.]
MALLLAGAVNAQDITISMALIRPGSTITIRTSEGDQQTVCKASKHVPEHEQAKYVITWLQAKKKPRPDGRGF